MTRTRSQSVPNPISGHHQTILRSTIDGLAYQDQTLDWSFDHVPFDRTMDDELSPGYFNSKRRGLHLPVNPMTKSGVKTFTSGSITADWKSTHVASGFVNHETHVSGDVISWISAHGYPAMPEYPQRMDWKGLTADPSAPDDSNLLIEALAKVNTDAWDLGTFLAEITKTVGLINRFRGNVERRSSSIVQSLKARKVRPWASTAAVLTAFSESWLEYRYGWRTLVFDLQDIAEALERLNQLKSRPKRGSSFAETVAENSVQMQLTPYISFIAGTPTPMGSTLARFDVTYSQVRSRYARASVMVEALANDLAFIDPLTTAWEIVPFSFIVDWFVNIGDLVKAYSPFVSGNLLHGVLSHGDRLTETTSVISSADAFTLYGYDNSDYIVEHSVVANQRVVESETYDRAAASPSFTLHTKFNVDLSKVVDLSTLFVLFNARRLRGLINLARL